MRKNTFRAFGIKPNGFDFVLSVCKIKQKHTHLQHTKLLIENYLTKNYYTFD